jgi:hypothetical protein
MSAFQITHRIKQDVRNARMIGEFTVKIGAQKLPGLIWGVVSKVRTSVYPESAPRIRPADSPEPFVASLPSSPRGAEPREGYDLLTGTQVVELLASIGKLEARNILEYECTHRNRAVVIAAAQSVITPL